MDQAKLEKYANWLVQNKDKKGTPEFDTVAKAYKEGRSMSGGASVASQQPPKQVNYQDATDDPTWIKNARTLYKEVNKADPKDDYEATTFLKDYLYDFNYRLAGSDKVGLRNTFGVAGDVAAFSPEGKKAFLDAQQQFENFDVTLPGMMEAGERILTDPTSFIGITGFGGLARQGVKTAAKEGVEELAKIGVKRGAAKGAAVGAAEGGAYAGASDLGQQMAQVNAGGQESIDPTQVATSAGYGAIAGGGLGGVAGGVGGYFAGRNPTVQAARRIADDPEVAVRGAEITQRMANLQDSVQKLSPETYVGKEQVNANLAPIKGDVKNAIDQLGLDKNTARKLKEGLDKASGISDEDIANIRNMPGGNAVAENILFLRQANAMTRPIPNDGIVPKLGRFALDKLSPVPLLSDPIKSALFPARISGELRVDRMVSPRNRQIAEEVLRLQGGSAATRGRQELLDAGLNMARARKEQRTREAAERAQQKLEFETRREERKAEADRRKDEAARKRELDALVRTRSGLGKQQARESEQSFRQNVRTNTGLGKQQNAEAARQEADVTKSFENALNSVNAKMRMQVRLDNQRAGEEQMALSALAKLQADDVVAKNAEKVTFEKALRKTRSNMKASEALRKFRERTIAKETSAAPAYRSRKFTKDTAKAEEVKAEAPRQASSGSFAPNNPIAYQAGTDTNVDFQKRALDAAERQPNKKLAKALRRAVEEMILARNDQKKRQAAYDKAADVALDMGPEALEFIDDNLYFLVMKYADK